MVLLDSQVGFKGQGSKLNICACKAFSGMLHFTEYCLFTSS